MALTSERFAGNQRLQAAAMNNPPLRPGETGDAVALVQQALSDLDYPMPISFAAGSADGIYGRETQATVRQFQMDQGFPASGQDGIAGRDTLNRLDSFLPPLPSPPAPRVKGVCWRSYIPARPD